MFGAVRKTAKPWVEKIESVAGGIEQVRLRCAAPFCQVGTENCLKAADFFEKIKKSAWRPIAITFCWWGTRCHGHSPWQSRSLVIPRRDFPHSLHPSSSPTQSIECRTENHPLIPLTFYSYSIPLPLCAQKSPFYCSKVDFPIHFRLGQETLSAYIAFGKITKFFPLLLVDIVLAYVHFQILKIRRRACYLPAYRGIPGWVPPV